MSIDDWSKRIFKTIRYSEVMKKNMEKKGIRVAKAKCPYCDGFWHGILVGPKQHLHMSCDGDCGSMMMG